MYYIMLNLPEGRVEVQSHTRVSHYEKLLTNKGFHTTREFETREKAEEVASEILTESLRPKNPYKAFQSVDPPMIVIGKTKWEIKPNKG